MAGIAANFPITLGALGPVFALIAIGFALKRYQFPGEAFWPLAEKLSYFLLFPALLVHKLALAELDASALAPLAGTIVGSLLLATLALYALRPLLGDDGPAFSSVYQGGVRFNNYVGLAAAGALFGPPGLTIAALAISIMIPLINVLCVLVLARHGSGQGVSVRGVLHSLARNPLILGCALGMGLNVSGIGLPLGTASVLDVLARAALPLGLLCAGAGLYLRLGTRRRAELISACLVKLALMPALFFGLATLLGLAGPERAVLTLFATLPTAPSAYILARQMGGDAPLMAVLITTQTLLALVSMPLMLTLLG